MLVTVAVSDLIAKSATERARHALAVRARVQGELVNTLRTVSSLQSGKALPGQSAASATVAIAKQNNRMPFQDTLRIERFKRVGL